MEKIELQCTRSLLQLMRNQLLLRRVFNTTGLKKRKKKYVYIKYLINGPRSLLSISRHPALSCRNVLPVQCRQEEADVSRHRETERRRDSFKLRSISMDNPGSNVF